MKIFTWSHIAIFNFQLPHVVSNILPYLLRYHIFEKSTFHHLHTWRLTMWLTLVNLIHDPSLPIINYSNFVKHWAKENDFFLSPMLVLNHILFGTNLASKSVLPFPWAWGACFLLSLAKISIKGVVSVQHDRFGSKYNPFNFLNNIWNYLFKACFI